MTSIYTLLNGDAKAWWWHEQLREQGKHSEARANERNSIKSHIEVLRKAQFFSVGRGGWSIYYTKEYDSGTIADCTLQHYGGIDAPMIAACIKLGIPGYDSCAMYEMGKIKELMRAPMYNPTKTDRPKSDGTYGSMSYAPIDYLLGYYASYGATVYNWPKSQKD